MSDVQQGLNGENDELVVKPDETPDEKALKKDMIRRMSLETTATTAKELDACMDNVSEETRRFMTALIVRGFSSLDAEEDDQVYMMNLQGFTKFVDKSILEQVIALSMLSLVP